MIALPLTHRFRTTLPFLIALLFLTAPAALRAQTPQTYREPPAAIARVLDAPRLPFALASPDGSALLLLDRDNLPPIAELTRPMLRLAGARIDPERNAPHGPRAFTGLTIKRLSDGAENRVPLPQGVGVGTPRWSPDAQRFTLPITRDTGVELWIVDLASAKARALTAPILNALAPDPQWTPDGRHILASLIDPARGPAPTRPRVPTGPIIQENLGGKPAPVRTYQDLLEDQISERQFDYYFTAQLALIDPDSAAAKPIGKPAIFESADLSPSGAYILVERITTPYSYLVPSDDFPRAVEIWSIDGSLVRSLASIPLADRVPIEGVITGPRRHQWRDTEKSAEVLWAEALDEGDPRNKAEHRDRLLALAAPFKGEAREVLRTQHRFVNLASIDHGSDALVTEYDRDRRWTRSWLANLTPNSPVAPRVIFDRSVNDRYADPGRPLQTQSAAGRSVIRNENGSIFLIGAGATADGDRPFIDRLDLASLAATRLWRNTGEQYESVVDLLAADASRLLTRRETPTEPQNYFEITLADSARRPLTAFPHPAPELLGITKKLAKYKRADGVDLSATLYLPAGYTPGQRLPLLIWAYPLEYNDPYTAGQVSGSPYRFTMFSGPSHLFMLTQGYAIMDDATMPVVGADPLTVNDSFIKQISDSAKAAIDFAASLGVADPDRVAVGGHSYGAFMTANLLAHTNLFRAGIARSGAYNRTLTPFGFQGERRTLWEAPEVYANLSPFMHADTINQPLLLIHGELDNNPGTFPMQSERLFHAIKGHGGIARLVQLPEESHGYRARESVGHVLAEMTDWLDTFVKNAPARSESPATQ